MLLLSIQIRNDLFLTDFNMMCYDHNSFNCYFWIFYAQNKLCRLYTTILCPLLYVILGSILCFPLLNVLVSLWKLPGLCMAIVCSHFGQMLVLAFVVLLFMLLYQNLEVYQTYGWNGCHFLVEVQFWFDL